MPSRHIVTIDILQATLPISSWNGAYIDRYILAPKIISVTGRIFIHIAAAQPNLDQSVGGAPIKIFALGLAVILAWGEESGF